MILSLILFVMAAMCNAVMDTVAHHHSTSIFKDHVSGFWSDAMTESWKNKYVDGDPAKGRTKTPVFMTDAWHFFKSLMICLICASITVLAYAMQITHKILSGLDFFYMFVIYGSCWNIFFGIFYNRVLIKSKS